MNHGRECPAGNELEGLSEEDYTNLFQTRDDHTYTELSSVELNAISEQVYRNTNENESRHIDTNASPTEINTTKKKIWIFAFVAILLASVAVVAVVISQTSIDETIIKLASPRPLDVSTELTSTLAVTENITTTTTTTSKTTDENLSTSTLTSTSTLSSKSTSIPTTTTDTHTFDTSIVTPGSTTDLSAVRWSLWGEWTRCSSTCASGIHKRYRQCIASPCSGDYIETEICTSSPCPVFGKWMTWASWGACDVTCGGGAQTRTRECQKNDPSDIDCVGGNSQQQTCSTWDCPDCSKTCSVGTLNGECDTCECSLTTKGRVLATSSRNPVSGASIFAATAPTRPLAITNSTGFFILDTTCTGTDIIIKKDGYNDSLTQITTEYNILNISKIVTPHFIQTPMSKKRLVGESLSLCCQADGLPEIDYYEWFQNSQLLDTALYPNATLLNIDNVRETHSGQYQCRANSPAGAIMSTAVNIQIRETPDDFCTKSLRQKAFALPSDCVQEATNTATFEVGECIAQTCRQNGSIDVQTCGEGSHSCCSVKESKLETVQCSGYTMQVVVVNKCGCGPCSSNTFTISGTALSALDKSPVKYLYVYVNGEFNSYTDKRGYFTVTVDAFASPLTLNLVDKYNKQFLPAVKRIAISEGFSGTMKVEVNLVPVASPIEIDASIENTLNARSESNTHAPNAEIVIPAGSFYDENGEYYNGTVSASFTFLDTSNTSNIEQLPGVFRSIDAEGETNNLDSLGVFNLYFRDNGGNPLSLGEEIEIKFPVNTSPDILDMDFQLWSLNTDTGVWEQISIYSQSSRRKKRQLSTEWIGNINLSDFEYYKWFNIDQLRDNYETVCYFKTRFYKDRNLTLDVNDPERNYELEMLSTANGILTTIYGYVRHPDDECIPVGCDQSINMYISSFYNSRTNYEHLYAAGPAINTGQYFHIQEDEKAIKISIQSSSNGPFYDDENVCIQSSSNPLQFYHGYTGPSRYIPVEFCSQYASSPPDEKEPLCRLAWYPYRDQPKYVEDGYKVCKAKVKVSLRDGFKLDPGQFISLKVTSYGGNESEIANIYLGSLEYDIDVNDSKNILCVEYKCSGMYDPGFENRFDKTEVKIVLRYPKSEIHCNVVDKSDDLPFTQVNRSDGIFEFEAPDTYGPNNGLYSATSGLTGEVKTVYALKIIQRNTELKCKSTEQTKGNTDVVDDGYAVHFRCYRCGSFNADGIFFFHPC
ncbi:cartilage intermediate layer protein 1-like isoform X1 [Mya arenaria]|uniref:cartilage intermediate layer protein 1-like isoform X1 n=1 Tax=Mya arenaria TaxID=6604 RepID=UPI0022E06984|nr:cartilage intermediate layer protein 1-like isoform X1 [Mya arenaria]